MVADAVWIRENLALARALETTKWPISDSRILKNLSVVRDFYKA